MKKIHLQMPAMMVAAGTEIHDANTGLRVGTVVRSYAEPSTGCTSASMMVEVLVADDFDPAGAEITMAFDLPPSGMGEA